MRRFLDWLHGLDERHWRLILSAWLLAFTAGTSFALWTSYASDQHIQRSDRREEREEEVEDAEQCVTAWEVRQRIRDAIAISTQEGSGATAEALIVVSPGADPERVDSFLVELERIVEVRTEPARERIPDPECDLEAARERLTKE